MLDQVFTLFSRRPLRSGHNVIRLGDGSRTEHGRERGVSSSFNRAVVLLAAIAVPVMAAPGDFGAMPADAAPDSSALASASAGANAMPFESPGMSFPGSAFYYLADPPAQALIALPSADPLDDSAQGGREVGEIINAGPAPRPFFSAASGLSHSRAQQCLAQAIWYEAASESEAGQRAVAQVVLNRVTHPGWPSSVCGVVYQGSQRSTGCQFTFTCDGSLARRARGATWDKAQRIAGEALSGDVYAPIGHATHYHTHWVSPYWAKSLDHVGTIGAHRFYRKRGAGGEKAAFTERYAGTEPVFQGSSRVAQPAPRASGGENVQPVETNAARPVIVHDFGSTEFETETTGSTATPATPATTKAQGQSSFSKAGQARSQYANSGSMEKGPCHAWLASAVRRHAACCDQQIKCRRSSRRGRQQLICAQTTA